TLSVLKCTFNQSLLQLKCSHITTYLNPLSKILIIRMSELTSDLITSVNLDIQYDHFHCSMSSSSSFPYISDIGTCKILKFRIKLIIYLLRNYC
ncbi:MAG: hypothetical protein ACTS8Y_00635, partial [Arsenophonus sp. ER-EMS1-MAG3]